MSAGIAALIVAAGGVWLGAAWWLDRYDARLEARHRERAARAGRSVEGPPRSILALVSAPPGVPFDWQRDLWRRDFDEIAGLPETSDTGVMA